MCGILALVNKTNSSSIEPLFDCTKVINHRGPDDEGFLLWDGKTQKAEIFAGPNTSSRSKEQNHLNDLIDAQPWKIGFGHKRLSILDLSPAGHQPMVHEPTGISITFNGEVFNYIEIREELKTKGYEFRSTSDTEVLLLSWVEWGEKCIDKFNGMFAFVILDPRNGGKLFAVRDRFGVKPLYWYQNDEYLIFSSEIKQIRYLPGFQFSLNKRIVYDYLAHGLVDHTDETFDENIHQLRGGEIAVTDLAQRSPKPLIHRWYTLNAKKWKGSDQEAILKFQELFQNSIKLRLRADVPVGSCLSGGLDSSSIVCTVHDILKEQKDHKGQETVTACYDEKKYDEQLFADKVIEKTKATSHKIFPSFTKLEKDLDQLLWHLDEPFGSTSQFSQWCVFEGASKAKLKVMLDGQGADELMAGYGRNDIALYTGLIKSFRWIHLFKELNGFKKNRGYYPTSPLLKALLESFPFLMKLIPDDSKKALGKENPSWLNISLDRKVETSKSLRESLWNQTMSTSLPCLLRYEDRNSMAFSIESRVPFLDYHLVEFIFGLPEDLIYKEGTRKFILREALKPFLPKEISERKDKMGFVTPEEVWMKQEGKEWFRKQIEEAVNSYPELFNKESLKLFNDMSEGKTKFNFTIWRIICLGKFLKLVNYKSVNA